MKQVMRKTANYAADLAGINSALYELGGLIIMHDASGCNSTYATHDEPRWAKMHSLIFISALEEYDAILGNDDKLIEEVIEAANETQPSFIALFGSPIALAIGTDFKGIAHYIEQETKLPCFGFSTSGMASYVCGSNQAYLAFAKRFCQPVPKEHTGIGINLLGCTPLDFGYSGNVEALEAWCKDQDFTIVSNWSMGTSFEQMQKALAADVNLVLSSSAIDVAKYFAETWGIPYVVGIPMGEKQAIQLAEQIHHPLQTPKPVKAGNGKVLLIGESVCMQALRTCLQEEFGYKDVQILCPLEVQVGLSEDDVCCDQEDLIQKKMNAAKLVIADPIYQRLLENKTTHFIPLPHWGYSGRMYKEQMPVLIGPSFSNWLKDQLDF